MNHEIAYRIGHTSDLPGLMALGQAAYGQYAPVLTPDNFAILYATLHNENLYTELVNKAYTFVSEYNGALAGMAFLLPSGHPNDIYDKDWCCIRMVGVHPAMAGQGVAKQLTTLCI